MSAVLAWVVDHPLLLLGGCAAWTVTAAALAVLLGRMIEAAEYLEPTPLEVVR